MISYALLLLLWIILPDFYTTDHQPAMAHEMHRWLIAACIPAFLYYSTLVRVGVFKKLYERDFRIAIGLIFCWAFTFLKSFELVSLTGEGTFNYYFDLLFMLSFPMGDAIWQFASQFVKRETATSPALHPRAEQTAEALFLQREVL